MSSAVPAGRDPRRLDVAGLAADGASLQGRWPLAELPRLAADEVPADTPPSEVDWSVRGESRPVTGAEPQTWLHLDASAAVWRECQRCLQPVQLALQVQRPLRFVRGEDTAAALDADSEDDVLELERSLDLRELVEDELLLELPLVPRHDRCPVELPTRSGEAEAGAAEEAEHPFAALAALKASPGKR